MIKNIPNFIKLFILYQQGPRVPFQKPERVSLGEGLLAGSLCCIMLTVSSSEVCMRENKPSVTTIVHDKGVVCDLFILILERIVLNKYCNITQNSQNFMRYT